MIMGELQRLINIFVIVNSGSVAAMSIRHCCCHSTHIHKGVLEELHANLDLRNYMQTCALG